MAISFLRRDAVFETDHRTYGINTLDIGNIKGLDPPRDSCEMKPLLNEVEKFPPVFLQFRLGHKEFFRVLAGHEGKVLFLTPFRDENPNPLPLPIPQPLFKKASSRDLPGDQDLIGDKFAFP